MNIYLFNLFHSLSSNDFINYFSIFLSYIFVYSLPLIIIVWIFYRHQRKMFAFSLVFLSSFFTWFFSELIKMATDIARPVISNPIIIESGLSFPSQHSAITMAIAVAIYSLDKRFGIFLIIISVFVGISRIVLGVHFPVDVLAGWVLGVFVSFIFIRLFKKI